MTRSTLVSRWSPGAIRLVGLLAGLVLVGLSLLLAPAAPAYATTYTVTTTADNGNDTTPTVGSLREAILNADNNPGADVIEFAIGGGGQQTIQPVAPLPLIVGQTLIDGWSQGGAGYTGPPLIELDGTNASGAVGLWLRPGADNSTVRGLAINRFADHGILDDDGADGVTIIGNYIGTDLAGTAARPNQAGGIFVGGVNVTIGGTTAADRNVIAGNTNQEGIKVHGPGPGTIGHAANTTITGNYIGVDATGTAALPNSLGIEVIGAPDTTIGGTAAGAGNLISGNTTNGVSVSGAGTTGVTLQGNRIGTNASGASAIPNATGIAVDGAPNVTIGGTDPADRNVISGNSDTGVLIQNTAATGAVVQGNYVGTNAAGSAALPNTNGILVSAAPNATIGGTATGARNVISGNTTGLRFLSTGTNGGLVQGNYVGTNATGTAALGNAFVGIDLIGAPGVTIGGTAPAARNLVSGNPGRGIFVRGLAATGVLVQGNFVGTDVNGTSTLGNGSGIEVFASPGVTIGGMATGARNVIAANGNGIFVQGGIDATGTLIQGNYVGTDVNGTSALGNTVGIAVDGAPNATVGGTDPAARNVVSGNNGSGIRIDGVGAANALIQGNYIGTNAAGTASLGNISEGILILDASNATVGGSGAGAGNVVAFNGAAGIAVTGTATGNALRGNSIFSNTGLGIDLGTTGVTQNDTGDADTGPNNLQNFPVLTSATVAGGTSRVSGTLNSVANTTFNADFYANPSCDPSAHGEGQTYLGFTSATSDGNGNASFAVGTLSAATAGSVITATATDPSGNTSSFSTCQAQGGAPGVVVAPTTVAVTEGGTSATFTVHLTTPVSSAVTITPTFDASQVSLSPATLTFQPDATALDPRTVTVTAVDDSVAEGTQTRPITLAASTTDGAYVGIAITPVTATITDNEGAPVFVVSPTTGLVTTEAGGTATFTVRLSTVPASAVTLPLASSDTTEGTVTPTSLTFQPDTSALTPRTVTMTGVDDPVADGPIAYTVVLGPSTSADPNFNNQSPAPVGVTNQDDEGATTIIVSPTSGLVTTEAGGTATFTVRLSTVPTSAVTLPIASGDTTEGMVSPSSLTFQPDNSAINTPRTVTVTGVDDPVADGPVAYTIVLGPSTSADPNFNNQSPTPVGATNQDDEGATTIVVSPTTGLVTTEAGGTATFTVRLTTVPTAAVTVPLSSGDATEGTVSPTSLTFQPDTSALAPRTVTVTGVDDLDLDGDVAYTIVVGTSSSADPIYNGQNPSDVAVTNRDDDTAGMLSFSTAAVEVAEVAGSVTLTVQRSGPGSAPSGLRGAANVQPAALIPVSVQFATSSGTATAGLDYDATAGTLSFGAGETSKTIVVSIRRDDLVEESETFTVTLSNPTGGATLGSQATITVTILEPAPPRNAPPNTPPDDKRSRKETEEQHQQRERTNRSNKDDVHTEGNVVEVHLGEEQPYVVIATRDGLQRVNLLCGNQCPTIQVGDYLEADGEKQHEFLFEATDVSVSRGR